jgi:CDP-glycerol glycerophosphotransferase
VRDIQIVILAAGLGTRLGMNIPKPLTPLADGRSILQHQLDKLRATFVDSPRIVMVVGYKAELVMQAAPDVLFAFNERYGTTNTSKSLLRVLRNTHDGGVLWLNGDVVFDQGLLEQIRPLVEADRTFVCVNRARVGDEEVKYTLDADGYVAELSKQVVGGLGEAVGINHVSAADKALLIERLEQCTDLDYFERGLALGIELDGMRVEAVDVSSHFAVEVDFAEDLARANTEVIKSATSAA